MDKVLLVFAALGGVLLGLGVGIFLGDFLGKIGFFHFLRTLGRLPKLIIQSPRRFKSQWKAWGEFRARKRIRKIKFQNRMKELRDQIAGHQGSIKSIKAEITRLRWQFHEPE